MKTRKLKNGSEVEELDSPIKLVIETKCPNKWKIIDMETGQAYIGTDSNKKYNHWQPDDIKIHMDNNKEVFLKEMKKIHKKLDDNKKIQSELAELTESWRFAEFCQFSRIQLFPEISENFALS